MKTDAKAKTGKKTKAKKAAIDKVPYTYKPDRLTLEEWQVALRRDAVEKVQFVIAETNRREQVAISDSLRHLTAECAQEMHRLYEQRLTPPTVKKPSCRSCSLVDLCLPELAKCAKVERYLQTNLYEEIT
jgi:CRISPR-associated exonuclease Cas4